MVHFHRHVAFNPLPIRVIERRREPRTRTRAIPARLTDLYHERIPVQVLDVSPSGYGLKVDDHFAVGLPVLLECDGLLIVGDIRHCVPAETGGYVLGMKIHTVTEAGARKEQIGHEFPVPPYRRSWQPEDAKSR